MKKSILIIAAAIAAVTVAKAPAAEARGLRIGVGFGVPFTRPEVADTSILRRAEEAQRRVDARERQVSSGRRSGAQSAEARAAKREAVAAAARVRAEKRAQSAEAKRQARQASAAARAEGKGRTAVAVKRVGNAAAMPGVAAAAAPVTAAPANGGERALEAAQAREKQKAEKVLQSLAKPAAPAQRQAGSDAQPKETAAPVAAKPVKAGGTNAAPAGECLRFIPGAGVTVKVSCTE
jgi:hypothetical protein